MACDTRLRQGQTISERAEEIRRAVSALDKAIAARKVQIKISPQGAIAFVGFDENDRNGMTDGCAFRRIMATGSALAKAEIARAQQLSGRTINRQVIGQGIHSHDGGASWHKH